MEKQGEEEGFINHIANITIVDDFLNKREIKAKPPSRYMKAFAKENRDIDHCLKTHLIKLETFGIFENNYDKFFKKRCEIFSRELKKRIIEQEIDIKKPAITAEKTLEEDSI